MATWTETLALLQDFFPMPDASIRKCEVLYQLAQQAEHGVIVELGSFHGKTAVALAKGAEAGNGLVVYAVDDYDHHQDWANNQYIPSDKDILLGNLEKTKSQVRVLAEEAVAMGQHWQEQVAVWFWDISTNADDLWHAWLAWHDKIVGTAFVRDTYDERFDSERVKQHALQHGFVVALDEPGVLLLKKT